MNSKKTLVAYFSCTGTTRRAAEILSDAAGADIFEIKPKNPYTVEDLDWTNKKSRSSIEMGDLSSRPDIIGRVDKMDDYDTVFVGFPIWWYVAPTIINTFLEEYDFTGKTVIVFATSGGSNLGRTVERLKSSCDSRTIWKPGKMLNRTDVRTVKDWLTSL